MQPSSYLLYVCVFNHPIITRESKADLVFCPAVRIGTTPPPPLVNLTEPLFAAHRNGYVDVQINTGLAYIRYVIVVFRTTLETSLRIFVEPGDSFIFYLNPSPSLLAECYNHKTILT